MSVHDLAVSYSRGDHCYILLLFYLSIVQFHESVAVCKYAAFITLETHVMRGNLSSNIQLVYGLDTGAGMGIDVSRAHLRTAAAYSRGNKEPRHCNDRT